MRPVAIVARGGTNCLAPFHEPDWEIWGVPWITYPRLDRAFEVHSAGFYDELSEGWLKEGRWRKRFAKYHPGVPVYCDPSVRDWFENGIDFPFEDVIDGLPIPYLENSIALMLAMAIHERRPEIGLYGVHMFAGTEADIAHASVTYMVGLAQGLGIKVTIAPGSPLFMSNWTAGRYGISHARRPKIICYAGVAPYE